MYIIINKGFVLLFCWYESIFELYYFFVSFFSLLIIIKYFALFCIHHIIHARTHTHTHTHTHTEEKRPGIVPILHKAKGGGRRRRHRPCIISFLFLSHPPTPTHQHIGIHFDKRKERIIHFTYYTLHKRWGILFCHKIYSYYVNFFFFLSFFLSFFPFSLF